MLLPLLSIGMIKRQHLKKHNTSTKMMINNNYKTNIILSMQYTLIWGIIHFLLLDDRFFSYVIAVSLGYGIGACWSGIYRGLIALSADPYALSTAFAAASLWHLVTWKGPYSFMLLFQCLTAYSISLIAGHIGVFLSIYLLRRLESIKTKKS